MAGFNEILNWFGTVRNEFESTSLSVYNGFVVPFDIDSNDLKEINHSIALVGGRGSGKTVFLRYFSHWTQFDTKQKNLNKSDLRAVILYWKPDTAFCRAIKPEILGVEKARDVFLTLAAFEVLNEFVEAIKNIGNHFPEVSELIFSDCSFWTAVSRIVGEEVDCLSAFPEIIEYKIYELQANPRKEVVNSTNPKSVLDLLVKRAVAIANQWLDGTTFKIFVDEFENLRSDQQVFINDYRKHSDARISWNVAYKEFANVSVDTSGEEKLQDVNDYKILRVFSSNLSDEEYKVLSAEIVLNVFLKKGKLRTQIKNLTSEFLCDRVFLVERLTSEYRKSVLNLIDRIFPQPTVHELCILACENPSVKKRVIKCFNEVGFDDGFANYVMRVSPQVAISHTVIFFHQSFQKNITVEKARFERLVEFQYKTDDKAFFTKVNTYTFTALLNLNMDNSYINIPVYSGFDRFCQLSSNSIRNVIALVFNTAKLSKRDSSCSFEFIEDIPPFTYSEMQLGSLTASEESINEIINFTPMGVQLSSMANRLGNIFKLMHKIKGLSEPEIAHFSVRSNYKDFPEAIGSLIKVAKTWRILVEYKSTKDRDSSSTSSSEYMLNPIYAPYFGITYRKIRKLEFSIGDFEIICNASEEANHDYIKLRNRYEKLVSESQSKTIESSQVGLDL